MHHVKLINRLGDSDWPAVRALIDHATSHDGHAPVGEHKFLRLRHGHVEDLTGLLAYEDQRLLGYAHTALYSDLSQGKRFACELVVDPHHRRNGIGTMLLERVIQLSQEHGVQRVDCWAYGDRPGSQELARHFDFLPSRTLLQLRHPNNREWLPPPPPPGVHLRPFRTGQDEAAWLTLNNLAFAEHPENGAWTMGDLIEREAQGWFDPNGFILAELDGKLVGSIWTKVHRPAADDPTKTLGEIYVVGVHPAYRALKLGRVLTVEGLRHLAAQGVDELILYVDATNAPAITLYRSLDFHEHHHDICYTRVL